MLLPAHDVGRFAVATGLTIGAVGQEVVAGRVLLAGCLIDVSVTPGVERDVFAEVGPAPRERLPIAGGGLPQGGEALAGGGIAPGVEAIGVERGAEHFDLRARGDVFRFADVFEDVRRDHARQYRDDDNDDEDFDQGEAGACEADFHASTLARRETTRNPKCYGGGKSVELRRSKERDAASSIVPPESDVTALRA